MTKKKTKKEAIEILSYAEQHDKLVIKLRIESNQVIQLGVVPLRIDILTSIKGMDSQKLWQNRMIGRYGNVQVNFISKNDLIRCKRKSGRKQDLADIEKLEKI